MLLPGSDRAAAARTVVRVRAAIAGHVFEGPGHVTASFGATGLDAHDTPDGLTQRVDEALYLAKRGGRDMVEVK